VQTPTGPTESVPSIVDITLGPATVFLAELLPGQVPADVRAVAHRLAPQLGAVTLRVEPHGLRHIRVELLADDPLTGAVARAHPLSSARYPLMVGRDEQGCPVPLELGTGAHIVVQGSAGSGKSTGVYGLLAQLAPAPDVLVVGSDITGLTVGDWAARPGNPGWRASVPITVDCSLILAVIEEFPGLVRLLSTSTGGVEKRARALLARLFGESRMAGMRLLLIAQRADANIIGGFERDQCSHAISFRVGSLSALSMLHSDADKSIAAEHATARPGVALLSALGVPLLRFRAPLTSYRQYHAEVAPYRRSERGVNRSAAPLSCA